MCGWVKDPDAKASLRESLQPLFDRRDVELLSCQHQNQAAACRLAIGLKDSRVARRPVPVLAVFGLQDKYVSKVGLNNTWDWVDAEFTLATFPNAGHFVQQDEPIKVSQTIKRWLLRDNEMP